MKDRGLNRPTHRAIIQEKAGRNDSLLLKYKQTQEPVTWKTLHPSPDHLLGASGLYAQLQKAEDCCFLETGVGNGKYLLFHDSKTKKNSGRLYLEK